MTKEEFKQKSNLIHTVHTLKIGNQIHKVLGLHLEEPIDIKNPLVLESLMMRSRSDYFKTLCDLYEVNQEIINPLSRGLKLGTIYFDEAEKLKS